MAPTEPENAEPGPEGVPGLIEPSVEGNLPEPFDVSEEDGKRLPTEQLVFFVRHAESRWNAAQASMSPVGLVCENDHGLSEDGRLQAEALRAKVREAKDHLRSGAKHSSREDAKWLRLLLSPDAVCSSPFTRALQTACLGLKDVMPKAELSIMREAREHKKLGGFDSTGIAVGEEIPNRVREELRYLYEASADSSKAHSVCEEFNQIKLDTSSVAEEWWGPFMGESQQEMDENIKALMRRLRRRTGSLAGGGAATVLVGHSLMIRSIFHTFMPPGACINAASLRGKVLPCCGVVGARILWDEDGRPRIKDAVPMLGTTLAPPELDGRSEPLTRANPGCVCGRGKGDAACVIS
eukprot:gb/GFBE01027963.1/.p1 GENE.gb/GFBE01027963.1/~~gb/GFBE01027963.1/.p1  ORF type:complete len:352 (+),score=58.44 gb/GFBE01027963.1/:1-1056(+)